MGWFLPSHIDFAAVFCLLGLWHTVSILASYISNPLEFKSRAWFPVPLPGSLRALELWVLLVIVLAFVLKQLSHATHDISAGVIQSEHLVRFQHSVFGLMFLIYITVALIHEYWRFFSLPDGVLQATFALGFLSELVVFRFGHHPGDDLESYVHMLMELVLASLVLLLFLEVRYPSSLLVALGRSMCLVFKGSWFGHIGFLISVPFSIPLGCSIGTGHHFPSCPAPMDNMRAKAIQVLIFVLHAATILVFTFAAYGIIKSIIGDCGGKAKYEEVPGEIDERSQVYFVVDNVGDFADEVAKAGVPILKELPRSLSRRMRSAQSTPVVPVGTDLRVTAAPSPLSKNLHMISSPLPKNIKNV